MNAHKAFRRHCVSTCGIFLGDDASIAAYVGDAAGDLAHCNIHCTVWDDLRHHACAMVGPSVDESCSDVFRVFPPRRCPETVRASWTAEQTQSPGNCCPYACRWAALLNRLPPTCRWQRKMHPAPARSCPDERSPVPRRAEADDVALPALHTSMCLHSAMMDPVVPCSMPRRFRSASAPVLPVFLDLATGDGLCG